MRWNSCVGVVILPFCTDHCSESVLIVVGVVNFLFLSIKWTAMEASAPVTKAARVEDWRWTWRPWKLWKWIKWETVDVSKMESLMLWIALAPKQYEGPQWREGSDPRWIFQEVRLAPYDAYEDDDLSMSNNRQMTRQEIKQLDTEIPWREIMTMPAAVKDKYVASVVKEYEGWVKWSGTRPLTDAEAEKVFSRPPAEKENAEEPSGIQRQKPRNWRTQRHHGQMPRCADWLQWPWPQTAEQRFTHTTQTCRIHSVVHKLLLGQTGYSTMMAERLFLWLSDAAQAFLQGRQDSTERSGPIYMAPQNDPLIVEAGACPAIWSDWQLLCTGKCAKSLVQQGETLCWKLDLSNTPFDKRFLLPTTTMTVSWMRSSSSTLTTWCGPILRPSHPHLGEPLWMGAASPKLMNNIQADTGVRRFNSPSRMASSSTRSPRRSVLGNLDEGRINPRASSTRTQIDCGWVEGDAKCLRDVFNGLRANQGQMWHPRRHSHTVGKTPTSTTLKKSPPHCKVCRFKATADSGLVFPAIPFGRSSVIVTFADSGWANAMRFASQFGVMVTLCPAQVREKANLRFLLWIGKVAAALEYADQR